MTGSDDETNSTTSKLEDSGSQHSLEDLSFDSLNEENENLNNQALITYPPQIDLNLEMLFEASRSTPYQQETLRNNADYDINDPSGIFTDQTSFSLFSEEPSINTRWTSFVGRICQEEIEEERLEQEANRVALITYPTENPTLASLFEIIRNNSSEQETSVYDLVFNFNTLSFAAMAIIIGVVYEFYFHNDGC